ncbi:unnamed protein product [Calicophoron daubneyi]|uniref:EGF-like domain-containing protein n=1 Tax=Calicophoron daubneyi TaxID=300641 RepID=A0AAV2TXV1_CALDB
MIHFILCCLIFYSAVNANDDHMSSILPHWGTYSFKSFEHMDNADFRRFKDGFPPGIYGSSLIPLGVWFHLQLNSSFNESFARPYGLRLQFISFMDMIQQCDESKYPRCSWSYFLGLLFPSAYFPDLRKLLRLNVTDAYVAHAITGGRCYPFKSVDQMRVIYLYHMCQLYESKRNKSNETYGDIQQLCPNQCTNRPCNRIPGAVKGSCQSTGIHTGDFKCDCEAGLEWEDGTAACQPKNDCADICNMNTTEACLFNRTAGLAVCVCNDGYMGYNCSQKFDPCVLGTAPNARGLNVGPIVPSGYDACGVTLDGRNRCNKLSDFTYQCTCHPAYTRDLNLPYDNCLKPIDSCDKRICIHGQCTTSPDLITSKCDCEEEWTGERCDLPAGRWSLWTEWSRCEPTCGPARHRRRERMCMSDEETDCIGPVEEVRKCAEDDGCFTDVAVEEETWIDFMAWTNKSMMITMAYIGALGITLSIIGCCKRRRSPSRKGSSDSSDTVRSAVKSKRSSMKQPPQEPLPDTSTGSSDQSASK